MKALRVLLSTALVFVGIRAAAFTEEVPIPGKKTELNETVTLGQPIVLSHQTHGSTGLDYFIENINDEYFRHSCHDAFDNPERAESMPGGDSGNRTYTLTPIKAGKVDVVEVRAFRGDCELIVHHYTIVDPNAPVKPAKQKKGVKKTKKSKKKSKKR